MMNVEYCRSRFGEKLSALRADFHKHPELGLQEHRTTAVIRGELEQLGIEILDLGLETGVIGLIRGGRPGQTVALRADIDALAVQEETGSPNASVVPGMMHACGHDVHAAGLLGAAMLLQERREELQGNVLLVFQAAEEPIEGAKLVLKTGIFDQLDVKATFALHVWPYLNLGQVGVHTGAVMSAKDSFRIVVRGAGGHGSAPHTTCDPIVAGSAIVCGIQTIVSRNVSPQETAVVSVCQVMSGTCDNVIPDTYTMLGSMRTFTEEGRACILRRLEELAKSVAAGYGCSAEFELLPGVPAQYNAGSLQAVALGSVEAAFGPDAAVDLPAEMISEDFSLYPAPSYFYRLGIHVPGGEVCGLHTARFYPDEGAVAHGAVLLANSAWQACKAFA